MPCTRYPPSSTNSAQSASLQARQRFGNTKKAKLRTLATKTPTLCNQQAMIGNLRGFSNSLNHQHVTIYPAPATAQEAVSFSAAYPLVVAAHHAPHKSSELTLCSRSGDARPRHRTLSLSVCVEVCRALGSEVAAGGLARAAITSAGRLADAFAVWVSPWGQDLALNLMRA